LTWVTLLLADRSPSLRKLVLTELLGKGRDDPEVKELETLQEEDPIISNLLSLQEEEGYWKDIDRASITPGSKTRITSLAIVRLGYLGFDNEHDAVKRGVEYIFSQQRKDGTWQMPRSYDGISDQGYTMAPLQTSIPLLGIAACGYATDKRAELAYDWLLEQRLDDGTWPTGKIGEVYGYQAGYRKMPHSKWGCRTNTTLALTCLAMHPTRSKSKEARKALDHLLARETRDRQNLGFNVARIIGVEKHRGWLTYHAKFDPSLILELCWRIGANRSDKRVDELVNWIREVQGPYGLWEYIPHPEVSRWITFDILRSLSSLDDSTEWFSMRPRTRYESYSRKSKRF
jgi:hypothetical protein